MTSVVATNYNRGLLEITPTAKYLGKHRVMQKYNAKLKSVKPKTLNLSPSVTIWNAFSPKTNKNTCR